MLVRVALNTKCQRMPAKRHWPPNAMSAAASQPGWVSLRVCQSRGTWILRKTRIRSATEPSDANMRFQGDLLATASFCFGLGVFLSV